MNNSQRIVFIVGPTAVGKSDVAIELAKRIQGEIVSLDSMQIYKQIQIASNKPSQKLLKDVPHHLISIVSVEDRFDVVQFNSFANECIQAIYQRGHVPIVVGPTINTIR